MEYNGGILQLQVQELVTQIRSKYQKRIKRIDATLRELKTLIEGLPDHGPVTIAGAEAEFSEPGKPYLPFPEPRPRLDTKLHFSYARPASIEIVGSYARKTMTKVDQDLTVDLAVTMPSSIFQEKDYMNLRYFQKRAYYLAYIGSGLQESVKGRLELEYAYHNDNMFQPVILLKPRQDETAKSAGSSFRVKILLAADAGLFAHEKLMPSRNCVRSNNDGTAGEQNLPTPFYNATLLSELCVSSYSRVFHTPSSDSDGLLDSYMLGAIWLQQRGLTSATCGGGFGSFEWACVTAVFLRSNPKSERVLLQGLSSLQIFKAVLQYICAKDLSRSRETRLETGTDGYTEGSPTLFDAARNINILFKMSQWSYASLRHEARKTLNLLNDPCANKFDSCFILKVDNPILRYDRLMSAPVRKISDFTEQKPDMVHPVNKWCSQVYKLLRKALNDRAHLVDFRIPSRLPWPITSSPSPHFLFHHVGIGILVQSSQIGRLVDKGPAAEDASSAAEFRSFWGDKAELRRFKDGAILESLVWSDKSQKSVFEQIVEYILQRHLGHEASKQVRFLDVQSQDFFKSFLPSIDNPSVSSLPVTKAFETLEADLRSLRGLPLQVRQVSLAEPLLRHTSTQLLTYNGRNQHVGPVAVLVQFEGSYRWPAALSAIQRVKIAFLLKIGDLLEEKEPSITTRLGLEGSDNDLSNLAYLEIRRPSRIIFHLRIQHEGELSLLEQRLMSKLPSHASRESIATALSKYKRDFIQSPLHSQAVGSLCTQYHFLSATIRLMKKWRDSHLLSGHISDEFIELLTAHVFVQTLPFDEPGSLQTGFLRTLNFIARWDWHEQPLIIDWNKSIQADDLSTIKTRFEAWRNLDPAMNRLALFVATSNDHSGSTWTEFSPSKMIAARMTALARAAYSLIDSSRLDIHLERFFAPTLSEYDFLIHLNSSSLASSSSTDKRQGGRRPEETVESSAPPRKKFKNLQSQNLHAGFDDQDQDTISSTSYSTTMTAFVDELRRLHGSNIAFFWNQQAQTVIAGLWNPQTTTGRAWKVQLGYSTEPKRRRISADPADHAPASSDTDADSDDLATGKEKEPREEVVLTINKNGVLNDIARLGGELISKIELVNE